jgi:hypothetical protein
MLMALYRSLVAFQIHQAEACANIPDTASIQVIGAFSDMRFTEDHAYGHVVELWRAGECVFGLFQASQGLAGDTPTGELTNVRYNPATRELRFTAKLTMGTTTAPGSNQWVPSRDLFAFSGRLEKNVLKGKLRQSDQWRPNLPPVTRELSLVLSADQEPATIPAHTYGAWRAWADSILRFRGPKW